MATKKANISCQICGEDVETYKCTQCEKVFCFPHLSTHREETLQQLQEVQHNLNLVRERVNDLKGKLTDHPSMKTIDQWESDSIVKIQHVANVTRQTLKERLAEHLRAMDHELEDLVTDVIQPAKRQKFDETHVNRWNDGLHQLGKRIDHLPNLILKTNSTPLIHALEVHVLLSIFCE
jgi:chromosome segregation ATPase